MKLKTSFFTEQFTEEQLIDKIENVKQGIRELDKEKSQIQKL